MSDIFFTENGWTEVISGGITFDNLKILAQAICNYFRREQNYIDNFPPRFAVGFDNRFLGEKYAKEISRIIVNNGMDVYLSDRPTSTPCLFSSVKILSLTAGIMVTGSDLPYEYSGIKICNYQGSILREKSTKSIEKEVDILEKEGIEDFIVTPGQIIEFNPRNYYFHQLYSIIDIPIISKTGIDITINYINSACSNYLRDIFLKYNCMIREINNKPLIDFGNLIPNLNEKNISDLQQVVVSPRCSLQVGFLIDGDGSKLKVVDASGIVLDSEIIFCIILKHLINLEDSKGGIVIPENGSNLIRLYCENNQVEIHYINSKDGRQIAELMRTHNCILGSSLNDDFYFNINNHILEKDAILTALILLESMSILNQNLNSIFYDIKASLNIL
ncbi:MAG: phosphoglucomutase [Candidatus Sericytochromatia bacterium]|nr:MAG: phosphoglucomutase [Candidatus Sericytochromatia bacterium]